MRRPTGGLPVARLHQLRWPVAALEHLAAGRLQLVVELDLPVPAREGDVRLEVADVRLDALARRDPHHELRVRAARARRVHRPGERAAEAGVDVGDAQADLRVAERLDRARPADAEGLADAPAEVDQLGVGDD